MLGWNFNLDATYLVFKQQGHNSLSQVNPCNLSIRQALEADLKIFLDSDCFISTGKLFQAEGTDTKGNLLRYSDLTLGTK